MTSDERNRTIFEFYLSPRVVTLRRHVIAGVFGANSIVRLRDSLQSLFGNLYKSLRYRTAFDAELVGKKWLVIGTRNQESSTDFLLRDDFILVPANYYVPLAPGRKVNWYPRPKLRYFFRYLPMLWRAFLDDRSHFGIVFHKLAHGIGAYENQLRVLARYRPKVIVVSNDHIPWYRALVLAARELGIPTVYLQHAPVGEDFPRLICHLSLLDGEDALVKYSTDKPIYGKALVTGMVKYDPFVEVTNTSTDISSIGLALSLADEPVAILMVVTKLCEVFPERTINVRLHPLDTRDFAWPSADNLQFSNARKVPALEFLLSQDALIAGETGVHLEAALLNVPTLYYSFSSVTSNPPDTYGFQARGLMPRAESVEDILSYLESWTASRPDARERAGYFVENVKAGRTKTSGELVREAIGELLRTQ